MLRLGELIAVFILFVFVITGIYAYDNTNAKRKDEVDVIHEYYSDKVVEEIKEGAKGSNFDKVVVFADGSKSYIKLNCSEDMDCEVEDLE